MTRVPCADEIGVRAASWVIGAFGMGVVATAFVTLVPELRHWMVVPVTACGVLVAPDVVDWARKRLDVLDPQAAIALMGAHFFFLAPLLHVTLDYWPRYEDPVADWRGALGDMAVVNLVGLVVYRIVLAAPDRTVVKPRGSIDERRLLLLGTMVSLVSLSTFAALVMSFGGPSGYLASLTDVNRDVAGYGVIFLISSMFVSVGFAMVLVRYRAQLRRHRAVLLGVVVLFILLRFVSSGLNGSRSSVIWPLLISFGMCHLLVFRLRRRVFAALLIVIAGFMYLYGFYKAEGADAIDIYTGDRSIVDASSKTGRDLPTLLLGDLGRSDIQALVLARQQEGLGPLGYGITYAGDLMFLIPQGIRPELPDKVEVGTDMTYGSGAYAAGVRSSRIYGLAGEAILNFGPIGAVLSFVPLGFVVRFARTRYRAALRDEADVGTRLLVATLTVMAVLALGSDLDNLFWYLTNHVAVLVAVVVLSRRSDGSDRNAVVA